MYRGIGQRTAEYDAIALLAAPDAAAQGARIHQRRPARTQRTPPPLPRLAEEGLPLKVLIELICQLHAEVSQYVADHSLHIHPLHHSNSDNSITHAMRCCSGAFSRLYSVLSEIIYVGQMYRRQISLFDSPVFAYRS
jgi:hypothetical protein